jgi:rhodanese-related sulfurtransferase
MLLEHGFEEVYPLKGGFNAWQVAGYPLESKS